MDLTIRWDIRAASAVLALSGTLVIVLTWSLVNALADVMGFRDLNFAEYLVVFALVRLPVLLGVIGGSMTLFSPRIGFNATGVACVLYVLFSVLWWAGEGSNYPPGAGIFGAVITGTAAYLAFKAYQLDQITATQTRPASRT